jgi:hypothetical protein
MRTPNNLVDAIRTYQISASQNTQSYFELQSDGSFTSDMMIIETQKVI